MGVDLTLMPLISQGFWVSHTHIQVMRRRDLWDAVTALGKTDVPEPVTCFFARNEGGDPTYGELETCPYGNRLTYLSAGKLASLADHPEVQDNWQNRGIWKLLGEMPDDYPIVLYWH